MYGGFSFVMVVRATALAVTLLLLLMAVQSLRPFPGMPMAPDNGTRGGGRGGIGSMVHEDGDEGDPTGMYAAGSSLPDCSHACGPCFPCRRVMVSFKCSVAESCPMAYRCTCRGRYYHVPSN